MKECETPLLENKEQRIEQFDVFSEVVQLRQPLMLETLPKQNLRFYLVTYIGQNLHRLSDSAVVGADGVIQSMFYHHCNLLFNVERRQDEADDCQHKIVCHESPRHLDRPAILHQALSDEQDEIVGEDDSDALIFPR